MTLPDLPFRLARAAALPIMAVLLLEGCATLPSSGPTAHDVVRGAARTGDDLRFSIVEVSGPVVEQLRRDDLARAAAAPTLARLARDGRVDLIGAGDVLTINLFEVGVSLFAGGGLRAAGDFDPSARVQPFPNVMVNDAGNIELPYAGSLHVAGLTTLQAQQVIERALRSKSQSPQALVSIKESVNAVVYISGEVRRPGRFVLTLGRERLLDAIALSGGSQNSAEDTVVRFSRGGQFVEERLGFVRAGSADDLILLPGDRVELVKRPRTFTVFGAANKISQIPFETGAVSLAEAIARVGGPNDSAADASAVFLFRYDGVPDAPEAGPPKIYRLNMLQPQSYFLSQRLGIRDKDVLYVANAAANQPAKLISIINQLFSPVITARALTR